MDELLGHIEALESSHNLSKSIKDVEKAIQALEVVRATVANSMCLNTSLVSCHSRMRPQTPNRLPLL